MTHLVDTSVLTRLHEPSVRRVVEPLVLAGNAGRAGISDLEVGFSARTAKEWDVLSGGISAFALVETTAEHFRRARQVQRALASRSQRGRKVPDLLVAAAAEAAELIVLHYDRDFDRIGAVTGQPTQWVVKAGSID